MASKASQDENHCTHVWPSLPTLMFSARCSQSFISSFLCILRSPPPLAQVDPFAAAPAPSPQPAPSPALAPVVIDPFAAAPVQTHTAASTMSMSGEDPFGGSSANNFGGMGNNGGGGMGGVSSLPPPVMGGMGERGGGMMGGGQGMMGMVGMGGGGMAQPGGQPPGPPPGQMMGGVGGMGGMGMGGMGGQPQGPPPGQLGQMGMGMANEFGVAGQTVQQQQQKSRNEDAFGSLGGF